MTALRIFSYQPNPRVWKATIAARLGAVDLELRGTAPEALTAWLWDFDARPLTAGDRADDSTLQTGRVGFGGTPLRKSAAFLDAHPFGTVPAAFSPDGATGIFESNSVARAIARLGTATRYGANAYEASRIDSFLDASLVCGRDTQPYLLALQGDEVTADIHAEAAVSVATYLNGIERPRRARLAALGLTPCWRMILAAFTRAPPGTSQVCALTLLSRRTSSRTLPSSSARRTIERQP